MFNMEVPTEFVQVLHFVVIGAVCYAVYLLLKRK